MTPQTLVTSSGPDAPSSPYGAAARRLAEISALLEDIRAPSPSRDELVRTIRLECGRGLSDAHLARIADAVFKLWGRGVHIKMNR